MRKVRLALFVGLVFGLAAGCNRSNTPAKVTGRVTYKGQPVKAGNITFHSENMGSFSSSLSLDGAYEIVDMPAGTMTVTVETDSMNPDKKVPGYPGAPGRRASGQGAAKGAAIDNERAAAEKRAGVGGPLSPDEMRARFVKVPKKYSDPTASPLKATIEGGRQTKDFDLTD
jgi:hypothetical protein